MGTYALYLFVILFVRQFRSYACHFVGTSTRVVFFLIRSFHDAHCSVPTSMAVGLVTRAYI